VPNYDWREYQDRPWVRRFPETVRGSLAWRTQRTPGALAYRILEERREVSRPLPQPCVFVSHQKADAGPALRIAYLACQQGFDYWLDILDPDLTKLPGPSPPSPQQSAAAVAAIIEMALLNSTHVIAVITPNTKNSRWVPYEYGRVKNPAPITLQAACWVAPTVSPSGLPEYLHLGVVTATEKDLRHWLITEFAKYKRTPGSPPCKWTQSIPPAI
jgi:hypothetical protein